MSENLAYETDSGCWVYENDTRNIEKYGYLYTWQAATKACPESWHLPTNEEYETMLNHIGGEMKSNFTALRPGAKSGFNALYAGFKNGSGFNFQEMNAYFWSSTKRNKELIFALIVTSFGNLANMHKYTESMGLSVRCIKNN